MTPEQWQRVKHELTSALALASEERETFLAHLATIDPDVYQEVESILRADAVDQSLLETPLFGDDEGQVERIEAEAWVGRDIGPYRLAELVGQGGMGSVYRASRADGAFDREVAVKLIRNSSGRALFLRRFQNERQILARLDHPNIARLLDGGASEGIPYLVMELVDGEPIDAYCESRELPVRERLSLFRTVCGAVQYAHQNLIVHRDLKPGNILVSREGQPKLLDFGIAKMLVPQGSAERALTLLPVMTIEFASPEQVRGEPITTASDVYSLGVILYLLLTGQRPYAIAAGAQHALIRAICEQQTLAPSVAAARRAPTGGAAPGDAGRLVRELRGDLDSIVMKALRKRPDERYGTAEQLAADIRRHLEGLPVLARRGSTGYRLRKFVSRHVAGIAVAAGVSAALLTSVVVSVRAAHVAQLQEARAVRRFNDVRELAGALVFDVHDAIRDLPGSVPARKILVERAIKYLDRLSIDSAADASLMVELATAYERVGEVQGHFLKSSLGDSQLSLESYQKGYRLWQRLAAGAPRDPRYQLALARTDRKIATQLWATGSLSASLDHVRHAIRLLQSLPQDVPTLIETAAAYELQTQLFGNEDMGNLGDAKAATQSALDEERVAARLLEKAPAQPTVEAAYERALITVGERLEYDGRYADALQRYDHALRVARHMSATSPTMDNRRQIAVASNHISFVYGTIRAYPRALSASRDALSVYRELSAVDPKNTMLRRGVAIAEMNVGAVLGILGDGAAALQAVDDSITEMRAVIGASPQNVREIYSLGEIYEGRGDIQLERHDALLAVADYIESCKLYDRARSADADDMGGRSLSAECRNRLGQASLRLGRLDEAGNAFREALALLKLFRTEAHPDIDGLFGLADASAGTGDVEARRADAAASPVTAQRSHWEQARDAYAASIEIWHKIPERRQARMPGPVDDLRGVEHKLDRCLRALRRVGNSRA